MHRSQALSGAFTMEGRAVRRPETGRFLSGGTSASPSSLYVTVLGAGRLDHAASYCLGHGQDRAVRGTGRCRARYGRCRARTISRSLIATAPPAACSRQSTRLASRSSLRPAAAA
jgi:hypothetical protein